MSSAVDQDLNERIIAVSRLIGSFFEPAEPGAFEQGPDSDAGDLDDAVIILGGKSEEELPLRQSQN